jgi:hypothetical protein
MKWRYSSTILDLRTIWRCVAIFGSRPLTPGQIYTGTHWAGGWMDLEFGVIAVEKSETLPQLAVCLYTD